jgi:hypothetical protein
LRTKIEERWKLTRGKYRIHPSLQENQSGVEYRIIPLVIGGHWTDDGGNGEDDRYDIWDLAWKFHNDDLLERNPGLSERRAYEVRVNYVREEG